MARLVTHETVCVLGEPEVWHQHPVLEDGWSPDGDQSGEARFAEKYSNRRSGTTLHLLSALLTAIDDKATNKRNVYFPFHPLPCPYTRSRLHIRVFPL